MQNSKIAAESKVRFRLGMAGFTYVRLNLAKTLKSMQEADVHYLCVKDYHLPLSAKPKQIAAFKRMCSDHGVTPHGVGAIYMSSEDEAKRAFDYAAELGVPMIIGLPWKPAEDGSTEWKKRRQSLELCEKISDMCAKYDIKYALHNHGRNPATGCPRLFATPEDIWNVVTKLDRRMGICIDVAYAFADGIDSVCEIKKHPRRLFDVHVRNISNPRNGLVCTDSTRGPINYFEIVKALSEVGFDGVCAIELVDVFPKRPEWIRTSVGYFRALMDAVGRG